jgi:DNA-binding winged helix-turn-helix (wHTH) protein
MRLQIDQSASVYKTSSPGTRVQSVLSEGRYVVFGPFQVDQDRQIVTRDGAKLQLQGKTYQVLLALLDKAGEIVTREELAVRLWPAGTPADFNYDTNLNTAVNSLRKTLGDSPDEPTYIETIRGKGYSLLIQPEFSQEPLASHVPPATKTDDDSPSIAPKEQDMFRWSRSDIWRALVIVGLIIAGMLLGAIIMILWMSHFRAKQRFHVAFFHHGRSLVCLSNTLGKAATDVDESRGYIQEPQRSTKIYGCK